MPYLINKSAQSVTVYGRESTPISVVDTYVNEGATTTCNGTNVDNSVRVGTGLRRFTLIRFDLSTVNITSIQFAKLILTRSTAGLTADMTVTLHRLLTNWPNEAITQTPASLGGATWRRSVDYNGSGGDVEWAEGAISAADFNSDIIDSAIVSTVSSNGAVYEFDVTTYINGLIANIYQNYGLLLKTEAGGFVNFGSQQAVLSSSSPRIVVGNGVGGAPRRPRAWPWSMHGFRSRR